MKRKHKIEVSIVIIILFCIVVWLKCGFNFETNDDRFIAEILSGSITGQPEAHATHSNYLLTLPLSLLYRITGSIPWYGGFLLMLHVISYFLILVSIFDRCRNLQEMISGICAGVSALLMALYLFGMIQYTSTAALLAIAGYVCLLLQTDQKKGLTCFFILELFAFLLRDKAMLLIQPFGGAVLLGFFLAQREYRRPGWWKEMGKWVGAIVLIFCIGLLGDLIGYSSPEWKEYKRFNAAREQIFDFYGAPTYEEALDILEKYEVTETQYTAFLNYVMLDPDKFISADCVEELVEYQRNQGTEQVVLKTLINRVGGAWIKEDYLTVNIAALVLWALVLLWMILLRKFYLLFPLLGLGAAQSLVWGYMMYRGRSPYRVTLPLFYCEMLMLFVVLVRDCARDEGSQENSKQGKRYLWMKMGICALLMLVSGMAALKQYQYMRPINQEQMLRIESFCQVQDYCMQRPQNRYIWDSFSFAEYKGGALETDIYGPRNGTYSGSWYSNSPSEREWLRQYLPQNGQNLYVIQSQRGREMEDLKKFPIHQYISEKTGGTPAVVDTIAGPDGENYLVWYFN